jgi:competence CoiA-like predicted nuclease
MPLRAVTDAGNVHAFEFNASEWHKLKATYREMALRMPCCGVAAVPKSSPLGTHFFAHAKKGECKTAPESAEHIYYKNLIAQAAQAAGWTVTTERPGSTPDGEPWIADVFCEKGSAKLALEVQMSPQTHEETVRRQQRYKASGVRGAWFYGPKGQKGTPAVDRKTPAFSMSSVEVGQAPAVEPFGVPLPEFVIGMLEKRLVWTVPE